MADASQAPTLDKVALPSAGQQPGVPAAPVGADKDRLMAGIRYGWAIEELVWRLAEWQANLPPQGSQPDARLGDFPPDLTHQRSTAEHIRELCAQITLDGPLLLKQQPLPSSATTAKSDLDKLVAAYE